MRVVSLVAGLLIGWVLLPTPMWVCGVYNSASMPAWVQAIGSVLAIVVAAAIPWWQEEKKRSQEGKQLSIATLRLRSNLQALGKAASDRAAKVRSFNVGESTPSTVTRLLQGTNLPEAQHVTSHVINVHHFEDRIQLPILQLLEGYDQYTVEHGRLYDTEDDVKVEQFAGSQSALVTRLEQISRFCFDAYSAIDLVDEERKYPDRRARNIFWRSIARRETAIPADR